MAAALRALLSRIVDYAGIYPPAELPLDQAVRNYAAYRQSPQAWMLGRFVCPAARLHELDSMAELFARGAPWPLSILGRGGADPQAVHKSLEPDLRQATDFARRHAGRVRIDAFELRLGPAILADSAAAAETIRRVIDQVADALSRAAEPPLNVFFEIPLAADYRGVVRDVTAALADHNRDTRAHRACVPGFKLRTGGAAAEDYPASQQLAFVLDSCCRAAVPFKATAGLHHPFRRPDPAGGAVMHGFINLFGGAALLWAGAADQDGAAEPFDEAALVQILDDEERRDFNFDDDRFVWQDYAAPLPDIAASRRRLALSFGSCSFEEPIQDLQALDLVPHA